METDNLQQVSAAAAAEGTVKMNVDIRYTTTHQRPVFFFLKANFALAIFSWNDDVSLVQRPVHFRPITKPIFFCLWLVVPVQLVELCNKIGTE